VGELTVLYDGRESVVKPARVGADDLWLSLVDLAEATALEVKPEGICRDELCIPVPTDRREALLTEFPEPALNLTEFARLIEQPFAYDELHAVWFFGPAGWDWKRRRTSGLAPEFALPDLADKPHALSELRGKKVFLLFWATW
jgi:hypothetical protein